MGVMVTRMAVMVTHMEVMVTHIMIIKQVSLQTQLILKKQVEEKIV